MFLKNILGVMAVSTFVFASSAYAGKVELSTYYPAPYGEYTELNATGSTNSNNDVALWARGNAGIGLVVTNANNVGIGTASPAAMLDVSGDIRAGNSGVACTASNEGAQRYNATSHRMEFCNGTVWGAVGGGTIYRTAFSPATTSCSDRCGGKDKCIYADLYPRPGEYLLGCDWLNGGLSATCLCTT